MSNCFLFAFPLSDRRSPPHLSFLIKLHYWPNIRKLTVPILTTEQTIKTTRSLPVTPRPSDTMENPTKLQTFSTAQKPKPGTRRRSASSSDASSIMTRPSARSGPPPKAKVSSMLSATQLPTLRLSTGSAYEVRRYPCSTILWPDWALQTVNVSMT